MSARAGERPASAPEATAPATAPAPGPGSATVEYRYLPRLLRVLLVVAGLSPWLIPIARAYLPLGEAGALLDLAFLWTCHRIPARTLEIAGVLMPLCSRCAGIFAGVALGAAVARPRLSMSAWRWVLGAAAAIMILEVASQDAGLHRIFHPTRLATGIFLGYAMAAALVTNIWPFKASPPRW